MALTNDQITAQNFKDFYAEIRPYLNGQIPTFANTFSKSDLYSTDEQLIGRWIDGKPLYQKVITGTLPNCTTEGTVVSKNDQHGIANVDLIFIEHAFVKDFSDWPSTSTLTRILPYTLNAGSQMKVSIGRTVVQYANAAKTYNGSTVYSVAHYTKTTDSSMSVSDGNEYSTSEQVVGKWIDGKPVYQKTVDLGVLPNTSQKAIPHGISNLKVVCSFEGAIWGTIAGNYYVLPLPNVGTNNQYAYDIAFNIKDNDLVIVTQTDRTWLQGIMTIRYTKTTD